MYFFAATEVQTAKKLIEKINGNFPVSCRTPSTLSMRGGLGYSAVTRQNGWNRFRSPFVRQP